MVQTTIQVSLLEHALLTDDWTNSKIYMLHMFLCISQPQGHDGEQRPVAGITDVCDFFNYVITTLAPNCVIFWKIITGGYLKKLLNEKCLHVIKSRFY